MEESVSLAGVAASDVGLLCATGVDMPFAACAYEKVDAAMVLSRGVLALIQCFDAEKLKARLLSPMGSR